MNSCMWYHVRIIHFNCYCVRLLNFLFISALALGYLVYDQVEKKHEQLMRKNPADYENDQ